MSAYIDLSWRLWLSPVGFIEHILKKLENKTSLTIEDLFWSTKYKDKQICFNFDGIEFKFYLRQILEFRHVIYFVLAVHKHLNEKYELSMGDSPDIFMVNQNEQECIPIEVCEAYDFDRKITIAEISEIVKRLHKAKGTTNYGNGTNLFIVNRYVWEFNVSQFVRELSKYSWNYQRIILSIYRKAESGDYAFIDVTPWIYPSVGMLTFSIKQDAKWLF